jgi:hypothetical protein
MNKTLTNTELGLMAVPITMTKREKLSRLANIVRASGKDFYIFDRLEERSDEDYFSLWHPHCVFALAAEDQALREAGFTPDLGGITYGNQVSVGNAKQFFELTREELHEFSCNCGGAIESEEMASRIERIAAR